MGYRSLKTGILFHQYKQRLLPAKRLKVYPGSEIPSGDGVEGEEWVTKRKRPPRDKSFLRLPRVHVLAHFIPLTATRQSTLSWLPRQTGGNWRKGVLMDYYIGMIIFLRPYCKVIMLWFALSPLINTMLYSTDMWWACLTDQVLLL